VESLIITDNAKRVEIEVFVAMQIREFKNWDKTVIGILTIPSDNC
jgi:hypothetical protein